MYFGAKIRKNFERGLSKQQNICQNGKKRVLRAVFTVFSTFFAMFSLLWLLVFLRLRHFLEEIFPWAYSLEFRKLAVERRDGIKSALV